MSRSLKAINQWLQSHLHLGMREQWDKLMQKLHGHFACYGITVLFARHFLIAGRGRRKPGGILGQVRSDSLSHWSTWRRSEGSTCQVPKFHSSRSRSEVALMAS